MKSPIIIDGPAFDWEAGEEAVSNVVGADGEPNMGAAMFADPGVMSCPACSEHLWREGHNVRCPKCGHEWDTRGAASSGKRGQG